MSNRSDFQEMREREAFENPQDLERPEERKPVKEVSALERRANNYLAAIKRRKLKDSIRHRINFPDAVYTKPKDFSDVDFNPEFIGPKMLTDFQKLHFIAEPSQATKDKNLKDLENGFKNLRAKSRSV